MLSLLSSLLLLLCPGHGDCVRGVAVLNAQQFLSCSNDTTIRHWSTIDGACLKIYYGHTNFVYAVVALPNGSDFVSCGEDRMLRVWRDGSLMQSIAHPTQSVWSACVLANGDIVTGARLTSSGVSLLLMLWMFNWTFTLYFVLFTCQIQNIALSAALHQ